MTGPREAPSLEKTGHTAGKKPGRYIAEYYLLWLTRAIVLPGKS